MAKIKSPDEPDGEDGPPTSLQKAGRQDDVQPSLEATLESLPSLLRKRQEELDEREGRLRRAEEAFARESGMAYGTTEPGDVLRLNVGGTRCDVLRRTLCQGGESMLAGRFSGRWDDSLEKDADGNFFVDQPFELFRIFLDHLRAREISTPNAPPVKSPFFARTTTDIRKREDFERMVEYYGCTPIVYPTVVEVHRGFANKVKLEQYPTFTVDASEWSTFIMKPDGHERKVLAYQIEFGKVERALIGWAGECWPSKKDQGNSKGVGEDNCVQGNDYSYGSMALDCCSSAMLVNGSSYETKPLNIEEGSVIRCEIEEWRWLVNGEVIVSSETISAVNKNAVNKNMGHMLYPAFSGKGNWRITEVILSH